MLIATWKTNFSQNKFCASGLAVSCLLLLSCRSAADTNQSKSAAVAHAAVAVTQTMPSRGGASERVSVPPVDGGLDRI